MGESSDNDSRWAQYDVGVSVELPGDEQALGLALGQAMQGSARPTLKAFSVEEVDPIIAGLP
jgi:uncharacterized protein with GYD domain